MMRNEHPASSLDFLAGGGEMGERIRSFDWASTPLGPAEQWPQSLKTIVQIMLTSSQPIWIGWGPDLIKLYNDPYKAIVGGKHPEALGQPVRVVWREIWPDIAPKLRTAMEDNVGTYDEAALLIMERYGYQEETYYTFSYSPVPGDNGGVGGIICANTDDTARIIGERQVKLLQTLAAETSDARTIGEACRLSAELLTRNPQDIPFALLYLLDQDGKQMTLAGTSGIERQHPAVFEQVALDQDAPWPFAEVMRTQKPCLIDDIQQRFGALPTGAWKKMPHQAAILAVAPSGQTGQAGALIVGLNPYRLFDESYQGFLKLVCSQISNSIANAQAYEEERKRAEALEEIDRAKTLFFSNVSHEFRTPLTLMLGPIEEIRDDPNTAPANRERIEVAHRNALRLLKLVNTLLDFSRLEAGRIQASYEATDLGIYTAELASNFRSAIEKAGMKLTLDLPALSEPIYVDRDMWEKIILNLLSNAFKFTFEGEIAVRLEERRDHVVLQVQDTGVGIAPDQLPLIFERFRRVEGVRSRSYEGSGIGLSLVQELVKLHKGEVEVTSTPGKGTTFTITLRKGTAHLPADRIGATRTLQSTALSAAIYVEEMSQWLPPEEEEPAGFPAEIPAGDRPRIVLADDNADMRDYICRLLSDRFTIEAVANGKQALEAIRRARPELVLTDVMMPEMDGFQLLQAIKAHPDTARIPVIMLSARAGEEATIEGVRAGADDYLVKPFSARELRARVITHIKLARSRYESERKLFDLFMQAPAAIVILRGPTYVVELANPTTLAIWGRSSEDVLHKPLFEGLPEVRGQGLEPLLEVVYTTGVPYVGNELKVALDRTGSGQLEDVYFTFVYTPMRDAVGTIEGVMVFAFDVTGQVLARQRAEESELRFRTLADNIPNLAWMADRGGRIYWYNSRWYEYTGTTPEQVKDQGWEQVVDPQDLPAVRRRFHRALYEHEPFEMVYSLRGADGTYRPFLTRMVPIRDAEGTIVQWFGTNTDITEQKRLERQKDEFLGIASHELKTPVTSIKAYTQLLERRFRKAGDERASELLKKMDMQLNKLTSLIADLLDVTRIESGKLLFHPAPFDYNSLIQEVIEEAQRTTTRHTILQELGPSVTLTGDRERIGQVLTNLLTNAIKYSPKADTIYVKTELKDNMVITSVLDFGIGIPAEKQQHLFQRFYRVEGETQMTYPGLGLGLYISAEFVKRHHGTIWVQSEEGKGTTFSFSLPLSLAPEEHLLEGEQSA
ncbi:PAS domain S-box-containing protein [Thermosporothrix hazakensis]|jgi:PAS domain S-box-containing protein|uniref:histidine kinase n=1 Tax=Thermosporothrix hazakensis TaxID=644383 RepID=A0A326U9J2_THEHA|nr:ATP-binding protein [Thermosporothrix hazakensis]PZW31276.1 PAS domain S-box-containing protein [Thermosporothrix hazakensis]GCE50810.1 two-component hybrid sensor and regulator [Thermosporothrix hazakensis]